MSEKNLVVSVFNTHPEAEDAIKELQKAGFDMKKLSVVGKDYQTDEHVVGYYNTGDRVKYWGKLGAFWGGLWGFLIRVCVLFHSWDWSPCCGRSAGNVDYWCTRRCGYYWRVECFWCSLIQYGHSKGQYPQIRNFS